MDRRRFLPTYHYEDNTDGVLPESVGKPLRDYKIYGNSIQDGVPSPEEPVEIQSVGDMINLLPFPYITVSSHTTNGVTYTINEDTSISVSGTATGYSDFCFIYGQAITDFGDVGDTLYFTLNGTDLVNIVGVLNVNIDGTLKSFSFTDTYSLAITEDNVNALITFSVKRNNNVETSGVVRPMISTEVIPYEPYGYKVPIKVTGKNLFDISRIENISLSNGGKITNNQDGSLTIEGIYAVPCQKTLSQLVPELKVGDTVVLNAESNAYREGSGKLNIVYLNDGTTVYFGEPITITQSNLDAKVLFYSRMMSSDITDIEPSYYKNIQIEYGTEATAYEPYIEPQTHNIYLGEPLRKVDEYTDYVEFSKQCVVRNTVQYEDGFMDGILESVTEPLELPPIPTIKGTTTVTVDTAVRPSEVMWQYYRK